MNITRYLPTFKQVEPNNLYGLQMGWVIAQSPVKYTGSDYGVATVSKGDYKFIENGVICSLDKDGKVVNYVEGSTPFLHYTEPLSTTFGRDCDFAVECDGNDTYLRLVALVAGTEFTTDNYTVADSITVKYATVENGVLKALAAAPESGLCFSAEETCLANGTKAIAVKYIG